MAWTGGPEAFGCIELPRFTGPIKKNKGNYILRKILTYNLKLYARIKVYIKNEKAHMQSQTLRTYKGQWVM